MFEEKENDDENAARQLKTYAETAWGCFTALRKRSAFAAASSRFVAAVDGLDFFGRLPKRPRAARRFCAPPAAGATDEPAPCWSAAGWRRGATSASNSFGQSSKLAVNLEPPGSALSPTTASSMAAAPKSGSSTSSTVRSGEYWRSIPATPAGGARRGFCSKEPATQKPAIMKPATNKKKKERKAYHGRRVGARIRTLPYRQSSASLQLEI